MLGDAPAIAPDVWTIAVKIFSFLSFFFRGKNGFNPTSRLMPPPLDLAEAGKNEKKPNRFSKRNKTPLNTGLHPRPGRRMGVPCAQGRQRRGLPGAGLRALLLDDAGRAAAVAAGVVVGLGVVFGKRSSSDRGAQVGVEEESAALERRKSSADGKREERERGKGRGKGGGKRSNLFYVFTTEALGLPRRSPAALSPLPPPPQPPPPPPSSALSGPLAAWPRSVKRDKWCHVCEREDKRQGGKR